MTVPYAFANQTSAIPLSELDSNFATPITIGGTPVQLGGTVSSISAVDVSNSLATATGSTTTRTLANRFADVVNVKDFGAVGDGVTDDTAAIQAAINSVAAKGGGTIDMSGGKWLIDSATLLVKSGVCLQGSWKSAGEIANRNYLDFQSSIILNSTYTINLAEDFSAICGLVISRKGMTVPNSIAEATASVAAFSGKAITVGDGTSAKANDTYVGYCLIVGFEYAYYNDYNERPRIEYIFGDCINGLWLTHIYDMDYIFSCHFWPFTTTHQAWTFAGDAGWRRQGVAFYFGVGVDWGQLVNCFDYGHDIGYQIIDSDNTVFLNCGSDGYKNNNTYSFGFHISGTSKNANFIGCKASSKNTSVYVDVGSALYSAGVVKITGGNLWACSTGTGSHLYVKTGSTIVSGGVSFFDGPLGVKTDSTADTVSISNCVFEGISTAFNIYNINNSIIQENLFFNSTDSTAGQRMVFNGNNSRSYVADYNNTAESPRYYFRKSRGTVASPTIVQASDTMGGLWFDGNDGTNWITGSIIRSQVDGAPGVGSMPGALVFSTNNGTSLIDRLALNKNGNLYPLVDNAYTLGASSFRWSVVYAATGTINTSDSRLKTDVKESSLGLNFINSLKPVSYKWIVGDNIVEKQIYRNEDGEEIDPNDVGATPAEIVTTPGVGVRTHWGFLAQDVKQSVDSAKVDFAGWTLADKDNPESIQGLRYDQFIAPLVKAVQELSSEVEKLKAVVK